jgi:hypothetical protein
VFTGSEINFTEEIRRSGAGRFLDALETRLYRARKLVVSDILSGGGPDGGKEGCKEGREEVQEVSEEEVLEEEVARTVTGRPFSLAAARGSCVTVPRPGR